MKKFFKILAAVTVGLFAVYSCEKKEEQPAEVVLKGISLDQATLNLFVGDEATLTVKLNPENVTKKPTISWSSSSASVATVADGKVKAVAAGEATITATADKFSATCKVTVTTKDDYTGPEEGSSAWSVIGKFLGTNWDKDFVCAKDGDIYVLKNVRLTATDEFKFRENKDWTNNRGGNFSAIGEGFEVTAGGDNIIVGADGLFDLYYNAALEQAAVVNKGGSPTWKEPTPQGAVTIDGNPAEWANLDAAYVASAVCAEGAELKGIKSVKAYYDDKLYMLVEVSDEALAKGVADGKLRFHLFFNSDYSSDGGYNSHWTLQNINYATEGKMTSGGSYCAYSSKLYAIAPGTEWTTSDSGFTPVFASAGEGNFYELSMELDGFPGGLASTIGLGFDVADGGYNCMGFMPNGGEELLSVVKKGTNPLDPPAVPGLINIDGDFSDWADIPGLGNGTHGKFKFAKDNKNAYFYTWRTREGRFADLWGAGKGYVYFGFDLDGNPETGESLNSNAPYEFVGFIYCFGGTADAPVIEITKKGDCLPAGTSIDNVTIKGVVNDEGAFFEYSIPLADMPALPETFSVTSWGNKDLDKVTVDYPFKEPEIPDTFDYTPSDEYNSADNLWKKAADANAEKYFHRREGAEGNDIPYLTKNQSTYKLSLENATEGRWSSQFFMHPDGEDNYIALEDNKIYKVKMTVQSNMTFNGFVKMTAFDPNSASGEGNNALWEAPGYPDNIIMVADQPYVLEAEISGKSASNISFTFDFGGNPAGANVYIKDIILVQTGEVAQHNPIEWDYTASEAYLADNNIWKAVDAANTLEWAYNPGWQPATTSVDVKFQNSTYEFTIPEAFDGEWMCQLWIHPTAELNLDPAKKYNFSLTYYSETAASPLFKLYKQGKDDAWCFTPRPTIAQYEVYNLEEKEFTPCEGPLCLLIDFNKATAGAKVFIKDIVLTEVKPAAPANIKEIIAAIPETATGNNTAVEFDVDLAQPVTVSYMNGKNIYVEDATAAILLFMENPGLAPGVTIKGKFHVKGYWYNGIPELVSLDFLATPELGQADVPLTKVTIAELLANYDKYLLRKCKISGVTVTDGIADGEGNGDRNGEVAQGDNKIAVYAQLKNQGLLLTAGDYGDLVCIPGMYKENKQVYFWQNDWFIPVTPPEGSGIPDYDPITGFEW